MENSLGLLSEIKKRVDERKRRLADQNSGNSCVTVPINPVRSDGREGDITATDQISVSSFAGVVERTAVVCPGSETESSSVTTQQPNNMAAPSRNVSQSTLNDIDRKLKNLLDQGPLLVNVQSAVVALDNRLSKLERKRTGETILNENESGKKQKSNEISDIERPIEQPGTSGPTPASTLSLEDVLSEGEAETISDSDSDDATDNFLEDLQSFYKETEIEGAPVSTEIAPIINRGLRVMGQQDAMKKLRDTYSRPSNVGNLKIPKVNPIVWKTLSTKGKCVDAAIQKSMSKFSAAITPVVKQIDLLATHKKEVKRHPVLQEMKQLTMDAMHMLSHAVTSSNQMRKDAVKSELHPKFQKLCNPDHAVSETQLFGDQLQSELKDLDEEKKFNLGKYRAQSVTGDRKFATDQGFRRGGGRNHKPSHKRTQFYDNNQPTALQSGDATRASGRRNDSS